MRPAGIRHWSAWACALAVGCSPPPTPTAPPPPPSPCPSRPDGFTDCFPGSGIVDRSQTRAGMEGFAPPNFSAVADVDEDGLPDVAFVNFEDGLVVYRNLGGFRFEPMGFRLPGKSVSGIASGDLDHDGHVDLVVSEGIADQRAVDRGEPPRNTLSVYLGDGKGHFTEESGRLGFGTRPAPARGSYPFGATLADLNGDGRLDVIPYLRGLSERNPQQVQVFVSQADGTWREVGAELFPGVIGFLWSILWSDPYFYLLTEGGSAPSRLFRRTSASPLAFVEEVAPWKPTNDAMGAAASSVGVFVADIAAQHIFLDGKDIAPELGATMNPNRGSVEVAFSPAFIDYDNDGALDLFTTSSVDQNYRDAPFAVLLRAAGGRFEDRSDLLRQSGPVAEEGLAVADFDRDGRIDLLTGGQGGFGFDGGPPRLLRNEVAGERSVAVRLVGHASPSEGIGAHVTVSAGGTSATLDMGGGGTTAGYSEARLLFGIGEATEATVDVRWPSGKEQRVEHVAPGAITVEEPR